MKNVITWTWFFTILQNLHFGADKSDKVNEQGPVIDNLNTGYQATMSNANQ